MRLLLRFCGFVFAAGTIMFLVGVGAAVGLLWHFSKDLPDYSQLQDYEPPVMTRVHAGDGSLVAEYANQRRLYLPIQAIPKMVISAFLSAEDKNFYEHNGLDFGGIIRAGMLYVQTYGSGRRPQGASTITQQVAKNFLLTNEVSLQRKIKEALLSLKIERAYSKEKILELYLNEIYLGLGAYGVAAASLLYFDKSVHELTVAEAAYLAALPKAPNNYNPFRQRDRAVERRNWVIDQMVENRHDQGRGRREGKEGAARDHGPPDRGAHFRRRIFRRRGSPLDLREVRREDALRGRSFGPYHARSQAPGDRAQDADRRADQVRRVARLARAGHQARRRAAIGAQKLAEVKQLNDIAPWRLAVVLETGDQSARIGLYPARDPGGTLTKERQTGTIPLEGVKWAKPTEGPIKGRVPAKVSQILDVGDVVYVDPTQQGRQHLAAPPSAGNLRRHGGDGPGNRPRARHGRRLLLRPEPVQPRDPGDAAARLFVQADRLCDRARQRLHAVDTGGGRRRSRSTRARASRRGGRKTIPPANIPAPRRCAMASSSRATP